MSILVKCGLSLVLRIPLSTPDLQLCWLLLELFDTVCSSEDHTRSNKGATTLIQEVSWLGIPESLSKGRNDLCCKDCTHVGPLPKLGLMIVEALDLHSESLLIPLATFGHMGQFLQDGENEQ